MKNDFMQVISVISIIQDGNHELDQSYKKTIKYIRELELVNFGLNIGSPSEVIEKIELSAFDSNLISAFSYQSIKDIYQISCITIRVSLKENLIKLINKLSQLNKYLSYSNSKDPKEEMRNNFIENSNKSQKFPLINELNNLWHILLDYKDDISEKIKSLSQNKGNFHDDEYLIKFLIEYAVYEANFISSIKETLKEAKIGYKKSFNPEDIKTYEEKNENSDNKQHFLNFLNEIRTLKRKTQNILLHLNKNKEIDNDKLQFLISEAKNHLKYFSNSYIPLLENMISINKNLSVNQENKENQEISTNIEINDKSNGYQQNKDIDLNQSTLKIYQFESDENYEEEFNNNYNSRKKKKIKQENGLMKELTSFLDKNPKNLTSEIIDFSSKSEKKTGKLGRNFLNDTKKMKINLNEIKIGISKPLFCLESEEKQESD